MQTDDRIRPLFGQTPDGVPAPVLDFDDVIGRARRRRTRRYLVRAVVGMVLAAGIMAPLIVLSTLRTSRRPAPDVPADSGPVPVQPVHNLEFTLRYVPKGVFLQADETAVSSFNPCEESCDDVRGLVVHEKSYGVPEAADGILGNIPKGSPTLDVLVFRAPLDLSAEITRYEGARAIEVHGLPAVLILPRESDGLWIVEWTEQHVVVKVIASNLPEDEVLAVAEGLQLG